MKTSRSGESDATHVADDLAEATPARRLAMTQQESLGLAVAMARTVGTAAPRASHSIAEPYL